MPTRSQPISPDDFAGLAALANDVLLPVVNRLVAASAWVPHDYSIIDPANIPQPLNPQPNYVFDLTSDNWIEQLNRVRADYYQLVFVNDGGTGVAGNPAAINSGPWVVAVNDPVTFPMGATYADLSNAGKLLCTPVKTASLPPLGLFKDVEFWYSTADAPNGVTITGTMDGSCAPDVTSAYTTFWSQTLALKVLSTVTGTITLQFTVTNSGGVISNFTASSGTPTLTLAAGVYTATTVAAITAGTEIDFVLTFKFTGAPAGVVASGVYAHVLFATVSAATTVNALNPFSNVQKVQCVTNPSHAVPTLSIINQAGTLANPNYGQTTWTLSLPALKGVWVAKTFPTPALNVFLDADVPPFVNQVLQDAANPYHASGEGSVAISESIFTTPGVSSPILASSARQQCAEQTGQIPTIIGGVIVLETPVYSIINQSTQAKATCWPVIRDTDFVPFDYGLNPFNQGNEFANQFAAKSGALTVIGVASFTDTTGITIRLVSAGSFRNGWLNGQRTFGTPIATPVTIYLKAGSAPSTTVYDLMVVGTTAVIPKSLLPLFINTSVNVGIQNNNTLADLNFDIQIEIVNAPVVKSFFPPSGTWECFSHSLNGAPWYSTGFGYPNTGADTGSSDSSKPIPQNGHCIFKLRATRLPLKNSHGISVTPVNGQQIFITIGQNKLQWDGSLKFIPFYRADNVTPFTITIQANQRDSGDIDVFWPVMAGNELVYQCATQVIIEPFVCWQPMFSFPYYSQFASYMHYQMPVFYLYTQQPLAWQYCLSFRNNYQSAQSGYPANGTGGLSGVHVDTHTQFPMSVEIYNDLINSLLLLPMPDGGGS